MKNGINIIHCSYHKCLTGYFGKVMGTLYNRILRWSGGYCHCNSRLDNFHEVLGKYKILSVNNHSLNLRRLGGFKISRFIRDPRDLVVSGYFYHKRGSEEWCNIVGPNEGDWEIVNGNIPKEMGKNQSLFSYLNKVPIEEGLLAEIEFRKNHFNSMMEWPERDPNILTIRYEDIIGNERKKFFQLFKFYGLTYLECKAGQILAGIYSAEKQRKKNVHIRNEKSRQWETIFTPKVKNYFNEKYGKLLVALGYGLH